MIGDSLMRYQYLSLTYFLRHHQFVHEDARPNLLLERSWVDWQTFNQYSSQLLAPNELCDCYRNQQFLYYENRYYRDPLRNINVSFFNYLGDAFPMKGRWMPTDGDSANTTHLRQPPSGPHDPPRWEHKRMDDFIISFLTMFEPKPTLLVLNSGLWHDTFDDPNYAFRVARAAITTVDRILWKTTNCRRSQVIPASKSRELLPGDVFMCSFSAINCFNLSWTFHDLNLKDYWDEGHFQPYVYTRINEQFFSLIERLTNTTRQAPSFIKEEMINRIIIADDRSTYLADHSGFLLPFVGGVDNGCIYAFQTAGELKLKTHEAGIYSLGPPIESLCEEGTLLMGSGKSIYVMNNYTRREFQSWTSFASRGYQIEEVRRTNDYWLNKIKLGAPL